MSEQREREVHRYFDDEGTAAGKSKPLLSRRSIALLASGFAIVSAMVALWLLQYEVVGSTIGLGLVRAGSVACVVSRRADREIRLLCLRSVSRSWCCLGLSWPAA
ncbi:MAG TPA: hypothetical protein H9830_06755 [Candidatus Agrococcus pullicola]|uniref:Uncharacterized protein n=1 Tax=Candidatus Agrococcus pullicola TaxID=2838429 RepID=A0A9D1YUX7_9MICO|nr:hypothetical protein [Candidatus Agrococcus pullicola]